jgi:hypothetical protein
MPLRQRLKLAVFALTPALVLAAALTVAWRWWRGPEGKALNALAWESSYTERGHSVPEGGPRGGYWGARIGPKVRHEKLGWREPQTSNPGNLDIDERGLQHYRTTASPKRQAMIIGGSVAFGAYASSIATTYFNVLGAELERLGTPADLTIVAAGAWKAGQEARALVLYEPTIRPDLVVFVNGLNDLTVGSRANTVFGEKTPTRDGAPWTERYHEHDYDARVANDLEVIRSVGSYARLVGLPPPLIVLQPSLVERAHRTAMEERLLALSLLPHASAAVLQQSYRAMRNGLAEMERSGLLYFLDCSRVFDTERATTFADLWHFSDFGHRILGVAMAERMAPILRAGPPAGTQRPRRSATDSGSPSNIR